MTSKFFYSLIAAVVLGSASVCAQEPATVTAPTQSLFKITCERTGGQQGGTRDLTVFFQADFLKFQTSSDTTATYAALRASVSDSLEQLLLQVPYDTLQKSRPKPRSWDKPHYALTVTDVTNRSFKIEWWGQPPRALTDVHMRLSQLVWDYFSRAF